MRKQKKPIRVGIVGIAGRMGQSIAKEVLENRNTELKAGSEKENHRLVNKDIGLLIENKEIGIKITSDKANFFKNIDVAIEFGLGEATKEYLKEARKHKKAFISGSTGIDKRTEKALREASKTIPVFWAPNMSIGANLIKEISGSVAERLSSEFDIDITDLHHKGKKDIPSGTAIAIEETIKIALEKKKSNKKPKVYSFRSGDSTGEHSIIFSGKGERIEIKHISTSREIFSAGAVKIAIWLSGKRKGYFNMPDYLSS